MVYDSAANRVRSHLETIIASGRVGDQLPSVRSLMATLGVGPATVRTAVSELVRRGAIEAIPGSGTYIAASATTERVASPDTSWQTVALGPSPADVDVLEPLREVVAPGVIDLASGYPDVSLQPTALIAAAVREAARRPGTFGRAPFEGIQPLRDWFEFQIDPERRHRVLIMPGSQSALSLVFRALCLPGDSVLMETPTYAGALVAARGAGVIASPVPLDDDGICIDRLEQAIVSSGARVLYVQPRFHNPTGVSLPASRRRELIALAEQYGLIVVEDDWIADLAEPGAASGPLASMDSNGHVVHIRSLTKSTAPGVRIAAVASVGAIASRINQIRSSEDFFVAPLLQETALSVVTSPRWPGHLKRLRSSLLERRRVLSECVSQLPKLNKLAGDSRPTSPLHLWLGVSGIDNETRLRETALRHGVSIVSGQAWHSGSPQGVRIRLSNGAATGDQIVEGVSRLASALTEMEQP